MSKKDIFETIDFLQLWEDKRFLGAEFLTWLWLSSEVSREFDLSGGQGQVWVTFESSIKLESGQGAAKRSVSCQTPAEGSGEGGEWAEALTAITRYKKVIGGKLRIQFEDREWLLSLPADTLSPKQVKITAAPGSGEKENDDLAQIGLFLDRTSLIMELNSIIEDLLKTFLDLRLSSKWESEELPRLRGWIRRWGQEAAGEE
ncbi:MAG: hypothetical protein LBV23_10640 [Deltaproteobacteria bacterium]|nr:hypothetical protein [Deltaproteobacteria bacterium]